MKTLTIFEPAMCCSSGVCGPDVDPALVQFAGLLAQLKKLGASVHRHNLAQDPMAFARDPRIRAVLEKDGPEVLPVIYVGEEEWLRGRYPDRAEATELMRQLVDASPAE
jgi:hypothetical protein